MILSLVLFAIGVFCYTIKELQSHGKLKWMENDFSFWGAQAWTRKWKLEKQIEGGVKKTEAFPLSSTALVWLTDGYHLMQFIYLKLFVASIVLYSPVFGWWKDGLIFLAAWYLCFNVVYKVFSK